MHGARPARRPRGPGHAAGDGEVDLERARAVAVAAVGARDARRQPLTGDVGDRAGREVEHDRVGRGSSDSETTRRPVSNLPPCSRTTAARASLIAPEPPRATGQP